MLVGEYQTNLTAGNRVAIPKKFREEFQVDSFILTRGYEGCLILVTVKQFENLVDGVAEMPFIAGDVRQTTRFLLGGAHEVVADSQGRVVVPESLREHAGLDKEIVFLGLGKWVELWDRARWCAHRNRLDGASAVIAERLVRLRQNFVSQQSSEH